MHLSSRISGFGTVLGVTPLCLAFTTCLLLVPGWDPDLELGAQSIACPDAKPDGGCGITLGSTTSAGVRVRFTQDGVGIPDSWVWFYPEQGAIEDSLRTDATGTVPAHWTSEQPVTSDVNIRVVALLKRPKRPTIRVVRTITLKPPPKPGSGITRADIWTTGDGQSWYATKELRVPIAVHWHGAPESCGRNYFMFKAAPDGNVMADSVPGELLGGDCVAQSYWVLGKTVGNQSLRVQLAGDPSVQRTVYAKARKLPWLAAGLVASYASEYVGVKQVPDTAGKATPTHPEPDSVPKGPVFAPLIGINFPLATDAERLRFSLAADLKNVQTDWYGGVSLLQLTNGVAHEDIGMDVQAVLHLSRRTELKDVAGCSGDTHKCATRKRASIVGLGLAVEGDASMFFQDIAALFK